MNAVEVTLTRSDAKSWWERQKDGNLPERLRIKRNALAMARRRGLDGVIVFAGDGTTLEIARCRWAE